MACKADRFEPVRKLLPGERIVECLVEILQGGLSREEAIAAVEYKLQMAQNLLPEFAERAWKQWEAQRLERKAAEAEGV